jgi:thioredoxin reductase
MCLCVVGMRVCAPLMHETGDRQVPNKLIAGCIHPLWGGFSIEMLGSERHERVVTVGHRKTALPEGLGKASAAQWTVLEPRQRLEPAKAILSQLRTNVRHKRVHVSTTQQLAGDDTIAVVDGVRVLAPSGEGVAGEGR